MPYDPYSDPFKGSPHGSLDLNRIKFPKGGWVRFGTPMFDRVLRMSNNFQWLKQTFGDNYARQIIQRGARTPGDWFPPRMDVTPERIRMGVTPQRIRTQNVRPERIPRNPPYSPPATGAPGNMGNTGAPISITYKFSDPAQQAKAEQIKLSPPQTTAKAPSMTNRPLINPLPSQAPAPAGVGGARYDRDWRRGFQSGRPQNQGFTNWLTRPARAPQAGGIWGRPFSGTGWGGGYNAF